MRRRTAALAAAAFALAFAGCGADDAPPAPREATVVLLVPGSGFGGVAEAAVNELAIPPAVWEGMGFRPVAVPHGPGKQGAQDVLDAVRAAREADPNARVCLYGESSGGTYSLLAAAAVPEVACVIAAAAPTDADSWRDATHPTARFYARKVFSGHFGRGPGNDRYEPVAVWRSEPPPTALLLLYAESDAIVPAQQGELLAEVAGDRATLSVMGRGVHPFVHGGVARREFVVALREVEDFVRGS